MVHIVPRMMVPAPPPPPHPAGCQLKGTLWQSASSLLRRLGSCGVLLRVAGSAGLLPSLMPQVPVDTPKTPPACRFPSSSSSPVVRDERLD
jgi:hypothetical protein